MRTSVAHSAAAEPISDHDYSFMVRGYSEIFHISQWGHFWSDPDSPDSHKENKKKDHQNRTIINKMAVISVSVKVPFLWTIIQVKSLKRPITRLDPSLGPPDLTNI